MLNPFNSFNLSTSSRILGLTSVTPYPTAQITYDKTSQVIQNTPEVTKLKDKSTGKSKSSSQSDNKSNSNTTSNPTLVPTTTDLDILNAKLRLIKNYSGDYNLNPTPNEQFTNKIFEVQLIDVFGGQEISKVFENISNISFVDEKITGNEALVVAIVQYSNIIKTFNCYFVKQNNDWFLYKTENL